MRREPQSAGTVFPARFPPWLPAVVVIFTILVFLGALLAVNLRLRERLRHQIAGRDAEVLSQLAFLQASSGGFRELDVTIGQDADPDLATVNALLMAEELSDTIAKFQGIAAVRLYSPQGKCVLSLPPALGEAELPSEAIATVLQGRPFSHFWPQLRLAASTLAGDKGQSSIQASGPFLEVVLPLAGDRQRLVGIVQLYLPGDGIAREYEALDRRLLTDGLILFLVAGILVMLSLSLVFRRLFRTHALLEERSASLLRANTELAMAARTSAVGAVAAHLLHGLKSPLSGLQHFVASRTGEGQDQDWQEAADVTKRMQQMVQEVVRVLSEDQRGECYEITYDELVEILLAKSKPLATSSGVTLRVEGGVAGAVSNREANLMTLILENLLSNAIQVTPRGGVVRLRLSKSERGVEFRVADQGPGFPPELRPRLFSPVPSGKAGGSGIGLAISRQLASHLGATLELAQDGSSGCEFVLRPGAES